MWIDRALDENEKAIRAGSGFDATVGIVAGYCGEHAGFSDITPDECVAGFDRRISRAAGKFARIYGEFTNADYDQDAAMEADIMRVMEIAGETSFDPAGMTIEEVLAGMDHRGELSDAEKREVAGIKERMHFFVTVPPPDSLKGGRYDD